MNVSKPHFFASYSMAVVLASALTVSATKAATADHLLAHAPILVIGLDNSGSSPALLDAIVGAAWPEIAKRIRSLPMAASVKIFTIGDASAPYVAPPPIRIQKKITENGGPHDYVVA